MHCPAPTIMLLPFFQWCETVWLGRFVVESNWLFPVIESIHLLALALLGGSILIVDLRMLGLGLKGRDVREIAREARPFMNVALIAMISTGLPLFLSEPTKCYYSSAFWVKMWTLAFALVFTYTIRTKTARIEPVRDTARRQMLVGALSIALWFTVASAGRWIGFS
ncbi:MAG TPA: DUF6644 family protein [Vicinamibacterales bacterium]|nr:DUF6644 family protein [Vicinamibacterales bacterium]